MSHKCVCDPRYIGERGVQWHRSRQVIFWGLRVLDSSAFFCCTPLPSQNTHIQTALVCCHVQALDRLTRLEVFQEHIRQLEEAERQEKEKEKEARRRQERRNRDAFRQLLQQHRCGVELTHTLSISLLLALLFSVVTS